MSKFVATYLTHIFLLKCCMYVKAGGITMDLFIMQQLSQPMPSDHGGAVNVNGLYD